MFLKWFLFSCISAYGLDKPIPSSLPASLLAVQKAYQAHQTLMADFVQITTLEHLKQTKTTTGHFWFEKPFKLRWQVKTPFENLMVCDGKNVWLYTPPLDPIHDPSDKGQCMTKKASEIQSELLNALIVGDFSQTTISPQKKTPSSVSLPAAPFIETFELIPVQPLQAHFQKAMVEVDVQKKRIQKIILYKNQDTTINIELLNVVLGKKIDAGLFLSPEPKK